MYVHNLVLMVCGTTSQLLPATKRRATGKCHYAFQFAPLQHLIRVILQGVLFFSSDISMFYIPIFHKHRESRACNLTSLYHAQLLLLLHGVVATQMQTEPRSSGGRLGSCIVREVHRICKSIFKVVGPGQRQAPFRNQQIPTPVLRSGINSGSP